MRNKLIAVTAFLATAAAGCLAMSEVMSKRAVDTAYNQRDEAELAKMCSGEIDLASDENKESACRLLDTLSGPRRAQQARCEDVVSAYEKVGKSDVAFVKTMARKMAECRHYAYLFEHVIHWGNEGEGEKILIELEEGGLPVEAELLIYLASHKGPQFFAVEKDRENDVIFGLRHITSWLLKEGHTQHCEALAGSAQGANPAARAGVMAYFKEVKCKEGIPVAVEMMLDEAPGRRAYACEVLGAIGDASVLEKVKTLAETDGYSTVKEEKRDGRFWAASVYPVRDSCMDAYGKIKLRN